MVNFGPLAAEIGSGVWDTHLISTGFASWQRYCTVLQQWASAKLCNVEQRAPPIFGRATITLGIGAHSSCVYFVLYISFDWWICAFVVLGLVFPYWAKRLAWGTSLKWPILCQVGRKTTTQSISLKWQKQSEVRLCRKWASLSWGVDSSTLCNTKISCFLLTFFISLIHALLLASHFGLIITPQMTLIVRTVSQLWWLPVLW